MDVERWGSKDENVAYDGYGRGTDYLQRVRAAVGVLRRRQRSMTRISLLKRRLRDGVHVMCDRNDISQVSEGIEVEGRYRSNYVTTWEGVRAMF